MTGLATFDEIEAEDASFNGILKVGGLTTFSGGLAGIPDTVATGNLAISVDTLVTLIDASALITITLAAGAANGQIKHLVCIVAGSTATLNNTNINLLGGTTTILFNAVGETATLIFDTTSSKWSVLGHHGSEIA